MLRRQLNYKRIGECTFYVLMLLAIGVLYLLSFTRYISIIYGGRHIVLGCGSFILGWPWSSSPGVYVADPYPTIAWVPSLFRSPAYTQVTVPWWIIVALLGLIICFRVCSCRKRLPDRCCECGYSKTGLPGPRCPECGSEGR
jgi:hypothetical protein